jgi:hypothetical protein
MGDDRRQYTSQGAGPRFRLELPPLLSWSGTQPMLVQTRKLTSCQRAWIKPYSRDAPGACVLSCDLVNPLRSGSQPKRLCWDTRQQNTCQRKLRATKNSRHVRPRLCDTHTGSANRRSRSRGHLVRNCGPVGVTNRGGEAATLGCLSSARRQ